ncbi:MAG: hypothetical protein IKU14_01130, partial [Rhodocyclaceae bacterium]|nr:hypothetical protein [Rhodocyclaceae bacterium]
MYRILQDEESLRALADMAEHNDAWQEIKADEWTAENVALVPAALVSPNDPTRLKAVEADEAEFWCVQIGQMPILDSGEINQEANEGVYRNRETAETRAHRARVIDAYATLDAQEQAQKFARLVADEEPHVLRIMRDGLEDIGILVSDYDFVEAKGFLRAVRKEDEHALRWLEEDGNGWSFRREPSVFSDGRYHLSPNWDGIARVRGFVVTDAENDTYRPAESHETPDFYHVAAGGYYLEESYIPDWLRDEPDHPAWEIDRLHLRDVRFTGEDGLEQAEELAQRLSAMDVLATPDMERMREKFDRLVNEEFARRNGVSLSHTDLVFADYLRDMRTLVERAGQGTLCLDDRYFVPDGDWGPAPVAVKATAYINVYKVCVGRFGREVARFSPIPNKERCECVTLTSDDPFNSEEMRFELDGTPWDNAVRLADRLRVINAYATLSPTSQRASFKHMASKLRGDLKDVVPQREQAQETAPQQRETQGSAVCVPTQSQTGQWGLNITTAGEVGYRDVGLNLAWSEEEAFAAAAAIERGDADTLERYGVAINGDELLEVFPSSDDKWHVQHKNLHHNAHMYGAFDTREAPTWKPWGLQNWLFSKPSSSAIRFISYTK